MLLPVKVDIVFKKKCCKRNTVRFFYFNYSKIVFVLLVEVIIDLMVITSINVKKACLEKTFTKIFYSRAFGFYYYLNHVL